MKTLTQRGQQQRRQARARPAGMRSETSGREPPPDNGPGNAPGDAPGEKAECAIAAAVRGASAALR